MARPTKEGLEYFPLVTNFEDKVILLIAEFGASAVGIIVSLYQKIYNNGYYIPWDNDSLMLFSRYINEEIETVNAVITRCFDRDIFDKSMYEKHGILTSHGIQKQYLKICKEARRKKVRFIKEYCLIGDNDLLSVITELTSINAEETPVNDSDNTQSKVKESKEKKSTVQNSTVCSAGGETHDTDNGEASETPGINEYPADFEAFWQAYPKARRKEKRAAYKAWKTRLKQGKAQGITPDKLITAARHYAAEMEAKGKEPEYIKLPKTFLGPTKPFEEYIDPPKEQGLDPPKAWSKLRKYINPEEVFSYDSG